MDSVFFIIVWWFVLGIIGNALVCYFECRRGSQCSQEDIFLAIAAINLGPILLIWYAIDRLINRESLPPSTKSASVVDENEGKSKAR